GIKTALNVTLDPAFSAVANIITNQDGFNYLDQLEDKDGRPLLQPDPTNPTRKLLSGKPVIVLSNKTIATDKDGKAPFIVGDLKEAVVLWDRQQLSLDMTKEGGS
ncbi:phage major capsid protein, partial [Bacillus thuringiensis]|nr:phage major capsid protein [Bacillus thuringiensis]